MPMLNSKLMEQAVQTATRDILKKLRKAGLGKRATAKAMEALGKSRNGKATKKKFVVGPRTKAGLLKLLKAHGSFVVLGKNGNLRLLTLEGYKNIAKAASEAASKHKPWRARHGKTERAATIAKPVKAGKRGKAGKMRKGPHWTQLPHNKEKVLARIAKMTEARKGQAKAIKDSSAARPEQGRPMDLGAAQIGAPVKGFQV